MRLLARWFAALKPHDRPLLPRPHPEHVATWDAATGRWRYPTAEPQPLEEAAAAATQEQPMNTIADHIELVTDTSAAQATAESMSSEDLTDTLKVSSQPAPRPQDDPIHETPEEWIEGMARRLVKVHDGRQVRAVLRKVWCAEYEQTLEVEVSW